MAKFDTKFLKHALNILKDNWDPEDDETSPEDVTFEGNLTCQNVDLKDETIKKLKNDLKELKVKKNKYKSKCGELLKDPSSAYKFAEEEVAWIQSTDNKEARKNDKTVPNLSKSVKRDYFAEEQATEIEKLKIDNKVIGIGADKNSKPEKILQLELEIKKLRSSNEYHKTQTKTLNAKYADAEKKIAELEPVYDDKFFERAQDIMLKGAPTCHEILFCEEDEVSEHIEEIQCLDDDKIEDAFHGMIGEACEMAEFREYQTYKDTIDWMMSKIFEGFRLPNKYAMDNRYL